MRRLAESAVYGASLVAVWVLLDWIFWGDVRGELLSIGVAAAAGYWVGSSKPTMEASER